LVQLVAALLVAPLAPATDGCGLLKMMMMMVMVQGSPGRCFWLSVSNAELWARPSDSKH